MEVYVDNIDDDNDHDDDDDDFTLFLSSLSSGPPYPNLQLWLSTLEPALKPSRLCLPRARLLRYTIDA